MKSDLKWELVCYHCLLLSFHTACDGTRVHHCLILTLDLILTSVSCHANDHKSVNKENVTVSYHKNRIFINRGGKTGKTDRIYEWYQHSKEVNQSAVRWQRGASIGRLAAEKTHPFLLEGWGCRQKAGTSPTVKCPYLAVSDEAFRSYLSHTLLWWAACMHTHRHTRSPPVIDSITLITWFVAYSQIPIWLLAPGPEQISEKSTAKMASTWTFLIGNIRNDFTTEFTMRNAGNTPI